MSMIEAAPKIDYGTDPHTGLRWNIKLNAMKKMVDKCQGFITERARQEFKTKRSYNRLVQEMRDLMRKCPPQDADPKSPFFLPWKMVSYCHDELHHYRVSYNESRDACVFVCVANRYEDDPSKNNLAVITALHYTAKELMKPGFRPKPEDEPDQVGESQL